MIRNISRLAVNLPSGTKIKNNLLNAEALLAAPGFGKTTTLLKRLEANDVVIAQTSQAVHDIRMRFRSNNQNYKSLNVVVGSAEAIQMKLPTTINNLHIDECTMFDYLSICHVLALPFKKIYLYGDKN